MTNIKIFLLSEMRRGKTFDFGDGKHSIFFIVENDERC